MHENPVVIVTGASRGLGASVAHWLALHAPVISVVIFWVMTILESASRLGLFWGNILSAPIRVA